MKRLCVFAHWDKDNIVDDYVIYYLNALKDVADTVIFASDCNLSDTEKNKLTGIADFITAEKHGEYDFGSYKRGFLLAREKNLDFDELIFANDSVYGPIYPLKPNFEKMDKKKCDFWGMTQNRYGSYKKEENLYEECYYPHLQSYFFVLKQNVFKSLIFQNFISGIKHEEDKNDVVINYEMGLSNILTKNSFKYSSYIKNHPFSHDPSLSMWKELILKEHFPFLKTSLIKRGLPFFGKIDGWEKVINAVSDYPTKLIISNSARLMDLHEDIYSKMNLYRKIRFKILRRSPNAIVNFIIFAEKNLFKILNLLCFNKLKKF